MATEQWPAWVRQVRLALSRVACFSVVLTGLIAAAPALAQTPAAPAREALPPERFSLSGWHRSRYAHLSNQFRPGLRGDDAALASVTSLRADVALSSIRLVGEAQDVRVFLTDEQSNVSTALVNSFDVVQAYVAGGRSGELQWQAGRFTMEYGSGRLVAQEVFRDVTRTFTGLRGTWPLGKGAFTAFATYPVITLPEDRPSLIDNEHEYDEQRRGFGFAGAYYTRPAALAGARIETYLYALEERDDEGEFETRNRSLQTVGARWSRAPARARWSFDVEGALQGGTARASARTDDRRDLDVEAYYVHAAIGRTLSRPWSPRIDLEYDDGSGDREAGDGKWHRFDMLFGNRRVDLAPTSIYGALGRENIAAVGVRLSLAPSDKTDTFFAYRDLRLAAARDVFASTGVRDATGSAGRDAGWQLDFRWRYRSSAALPFDLGATYLSASRFLRDAPNATREGDTTYVYSDFTYTFGGR
jgi:hypothetical protein